MHWFVVPSLEGPVTGGTLYNRMLIAELRRQGLACTVVSPGRLLSLLVRAGQDDPIWIDSLFLDAFSELAQRASRYRAGLIVHYLPTLVALGERLDQHALSPSERTALCTATTFLVPSPFMRGVLERLTNDARPILAVEPGCMATRAPRLPDWPVRATLVANLLPGKRINEFLVELAQRLSPTDQFELTIVGGSTLDAEYAERCKETVEAPRLHNRVRILGAREPEQVLEHMAGSNLLLSASAMESYGMVLAEGRTIGLPILATAGGNAIDHVSPAWGGELVSTPAELAKACLRLCRDPAEHRRRLSLASTRARAPRPWSMAAQDFIRQVTQLSPSRPAPAHGAMRFAG
jgi:glycosyltransferase involved in cell wall biosynthesis